MKDQLAVDSDLPSLEETPTSPVPGVHLYEFGSKYDDYYPPVYEIDSKKYGDSIPWTLLQLAAGLGKQKSVDFLISKGADVNIKNKAGNTAEMISKKLNKNICFLKK
eukprot:gene7662-11982_t